MKTEYLTERLCVLVSSDVHDDLYICGRVCFGVHVYGCLHIYVRVWGGLHVHCGLYICGRVYVDVCKVFCISVVVSRLRKMTSRS